MTRSNLAIVAAVGLDGVSRPETSDPNPIYSVAKVVIELDEIVPIGIELSVSEGYYYTEGHRR